MCEYAESKAGQRPITLFAHLKSRLGCLRHAHLCVTWLSGCATRRCSSATWLRQRLDLPALLLQQGHQVRRDLAGQPRSAGHAPALLLLPLLLRLLRGAVLRARRRAATGCAGCPPPPRRRPTAKVNGEPKLAGVAIARLELRFGWHRGQPRG